MRKVETDMVRLVRETINRANVSGRVWKSGNTEIHQLHYGVAGTVGYYRTIEVWLHGNLIAVIEPDTMRMSLYDRGYRTRTTKARLNALLEGFARANPRIIQTDFRWKIDGEAWEGQYECAII